MSFSITSFGKDSVVSSHIIFHCFCLNCCTQFTSNATTEIFAPWHTNILTKYFFYQPSTHSHLFKFHIADGASHLTICDSFLLILLIPYYHVLVVSSYISSLFLSFFIMSKAYFTTFADNSGTFIYSYLIFLIVNNITVMHS